MSRRAKIVCTLGPATGSLEQVTALVESGMDVARLNFSHGAHADHERAYQLVREASDTTGGAPRGRDWHVAAVRSGGPRCQRSATAVGVTGRGSIDAPVSQVSAAAAAARPSAMAQTISDWPRRESPQAKTPGTVVA